MAGSSPAMTLDIVIANGFTPDSRDSLPTMDAFIAAFPFDAARYAEDSRLMVNIRRDGIGL